MTHIAICKQNDGSGWVTLRKQGGNQWHVADTSGLRLEPVIAAILDDLRKGQHRGNFNFTFTDRRLEEIAATPIAENPEDLQALIGASISIFAPEGRADDETMWGSAWLDPSGTLSSPGISGRFRGKVVADQLEAWFQREDFRSFEPPHHRERMSPHTINRPPFRRELLMRHGHAWCIRGLVPDAFPPAEVAIKQQQHFEAARAAYLERRAQKSPKAKRQALQAQWAREREARKVDPVAAEAARKARYGLDWGPPPDAAA